MVIFRRTQVTTRDQLTRDCLAAVRQWLGCETVGEIGIDYQGYGLQLKVVDYGAAEKRLADRAVRAFQSECRTHYHIVNEMPALELLRVRHR